MIDRKLNGNRVSYRKVWVFRGKRMRNIMVFRIEKKMERI